MEGKLRILLADASLELAPPRLWRHPDVEATARKHGIDPASVVLDKSLHYRALALLPEKWKRGRPDILHVTLLNIIDSPLAEMGLIELAFHTIQGRTFIVDPRTRIPVHYERFKGLMAQLLRTGRVPPRGVPLIWEDRRLLHRVRRDGAILLDEGGEPVSLESLVREAVSQGLWLIVGAFPRGGFSQSVRLVASGVYSIYGGRPLRAWTVVSRILCKAEEILGVDAGTGK